MNILPTIVQESVSQCKKQGFVVSAALASFFLRCQLLTAPKDPQNNVEMTPDQVERLVNAAVRTLTLADSPMLEMYKLQASITASQQEQLNQIRTEKVQHKAKSHRLIEDLWAKRDANEVFGDITMYILHETRLLDDNSEAVQRETMAALEQVFPRALMDSFVSQADAEKARQVDEIWRIVWGIRLFGKFCGKGGGAGVPDLLGGAKQLVNGTLHAAFELLNEMERSVKEHAAVLTSPSLQIPDAQRVRLQDAYHNRLQLKFYTTSLIQSAKQLLRKIDEFEPVWEAALSDTRDIVQGSEAAAVPKSAVYPRFILVSERWDVLFGIHREARDTRALFDVMASYSQSFTSALRAADVEHALAGVAEERACNRDLIASEVSKHAGGLDYHADLSEDKKESRLEFNGFCVVSMLDDGVLLESNKDDVMSPGYLFLQANSAYYSFSTERALKSFARDPFKYLSQRLMDTVASTPVLVHLLGLQPYLPKELYLSGSRKHDIAKVVEKGDGSTQTGHIDSYKDTHYVWNEWELRRLALQLAGLRSKRTKSTQTVLSHFRRDNDSQAFLPKAQGAQTLVDAAVQPPRVAQYIKGLRGTESSKIETVQKVFLY